VYQQETLYRSGVFVSVGKEREEKRGTIARTELLG